MYDAKFDETWQGAQQRRSTRKQFRTLLAEVDLNRTTAARYLGLSIRTVRRMAAGTAKVPVSVLLLLNLMRKHKEVALVPEKKRRKKG